MSKQLRLFLLCVLGGAAIGAAAAQWPLLTQRGQPTDSPGDDTAPPPLVSDADLTPKSFGTTAAYDYPKVKINSAIAQDFSLSEIANLHDMEQAYGVTLTEAERTALGQRKFIIKPLLETSIRPEITRQEDPTREFISLYQAVNGPTDYKSRTPANALFYSADVFFNTYNNLYTELLKEMENEIFAVSVTSLTKSFYESANQQLVSATTDAEKAKWTEVRNYFAVPYAIFSTAAKPLQSSDYYQGGEMVDPSEVQANFAEKDATVDTYDASARFIKQLPLDAVSERAVLADLRVIYKADNKGIPAVFANDYAAYAKQEGVTFSVDFSQFTPRGTYTSSSLRRQYFRGMKWYIMVPFFLKSQPLTADAFAIAQLMAEHPEALRDYNRLEAAITFLVGSSDDLMPVDYLLALQAGTKASDPRQAAFDYLVKAHDPKIKDVAAGYGSVGTEQSDEVRLKTKGLRFFSGKFILDSYWTGYLTQGDEAPRPGYTRKLPPMASSLEVMSLLGSAYAQRQIAKLDFYTPNHAQAIDQAMQRLRQETAQLRPQDWQQNLYTGWLWTIQGLFSWSQEHASELPRFMQSPAWEVKTLMTGSGFWTELRHATILYAKQSFAELGGGPDDACDPSSIPPAPKAYLEPQLEAYQRLHYLARRTYQGLQEQNYDLDNLRPLQNFINLMDTVLSYVRRELGNDTLREQVQAKQRPDPKDPKQTCTEQFITGESDWETLRLKLVSDLDAASPIPAEGPILSAKDRRAALVADVHTGGDSEYPPSILYEGVGVPYVIFTAVRDANGPRLTVGFTYSHYEFTTGYGGQRMTDEQWQQRFYQGEDPEHAFLYTDQVTWPKVNPWYAPLWDGS